jgi:hypothetical protein
MLHVEFAQTQFHALVNLLTIPKHRHALLFLGEKAKQKFKIIHQIGFGISITRVSDKNALKTAPLGQLPHPAYLNSLK